MSLPSPNDEARPPARRVQRAETKTLTPDEARCRPSSPSLRRHRVRQLEEQLKAGHHWQDHGLVFTTTIGSPIDSRNVTKAFQSLPAEAGLPRMRFHDLRHSAATMMLAEGVPTRVIMETLGHSDIGMAMNLYAHGSVS